MRAGAALTVALGALLVAGDTLQALEGLLPPYLLDTAPDILRAASDACDLLPLETVFSAVALREVWSGVRVVEVTGAGRRTLPVKAVGRAVRGVGRGVVVYVPGWWNSPHDEAARALTAALLKHHRSVLVLDTRSAFCRGYVSAAARVPTLARALYTLIEQLAAAGVDPAKVHILGFSLGAHVAGAAGRLVRQRMGRAVGRITALDPAKPCFGRSGMRVSLRDASFVEVVHSSAGLLGLEEPVGHLDVYLEPDEECARRPLPFECDHNRAWRVYAGSVSGRMAARRCRTRHELQAGACSGERTLVGYHCTNRTRGIYLYTNT